MTEQIWSNTIRIFRESSVRSGVPDGDVYDIPIGPAATARRVEVWGGRVDVFRQSLPATPLIEYHEGRMTFSAGLRLLGFLLAQHSSEVSGKYRFDRNGATPTFCIQIETDSDKFAFRGIAFQEIQLVATPPAIVSLDVSFFALDRIVIGSLLAATADLYSDPIAANLCSVSYAPGLWGANPRTDNALEGAYSVQWFFTRRQLDAARFEADGRPSRFTSSPWRVMAELITGASTLTRQAKTKAVGRLALFLGETGESLDLVSDNVALFTNEDPLKDIDFREETMMVECHPDIHGSTLSVTDISGLIPS